MTCISLCWMRQAALIDTPRRRERLHAGDAMLGLSDDVHRPEPDRQRQLGVVEDRHGGQRCLPPATRILEELATLELRVGRAAAPRTTEAVGSAEVEKSGPALRFGSVFGLEGRVNQALLELDFIAAHGRNPRRFSSEESAPPIAKNG